MKLGRSRFPNLDVGLPGPVGWTTNHGAQRRDAPGNFLLTKGEEDMKYWRERYIALVQRGHQQKTRHFLLWYINEIYMKWTVSEFSEWSEIAWVIEKDVRLGARWFGMIKRPGAGWLSATLEVIFWKGTSWWDKRLHDLVCHADRKSFHDGSQIHLELPGHVRYFGLVELCAQGHGLCPATAWGTNFLVLQIIWTPIYSWMIFQLTGSQWSFHL